MEREPTRVATWQGRGSEPGPPTSRSLCGVWGRLCTYLDPLDALGDDVGVVHGHQRDLDSSHPAHSARPHPCGQSRDRSALLLQAGLPARWPEGAPADPLSPQHILHITPRPPPRDRPGWGRSQCGHRELQPLPTCTVDHTGRLDGAVLCLHSRDPPHSKVIGPHTDAGHWAVLDDLGERGAASRAAGGSVRVLTTPATTGHHRSHGTRDPCSCNTPRKLG